MRGVTDRRVVGKLVGGGPEAVCADAAPGVTTTTVIAAMITTNTAPARPSSGCASTNRTLPAYALARMSDPGRALRVRPPLARLFGALALALTVVVIVAAPASAHAVLLSETPRANSTVRTSPSAIDLTFSENVEVSFGSISVFNEKGDRVDIGAPQHVASPAHTVSSSVGHLGTGAYVVTWRVISADSHPVHGALTFTVGNSSANADALAAKLEGQGGGTKSVGVLFPIAPPPASPGMPPPLLPVPSPVAL